MKLLLAEDEIELANALSMILKRHNYSIDVAYDGEEALSFIGCNKYNLIILDIMMPKIDGIKVLKELRSNKIKTPVLLLTAKSEIEDKVEGLDAGADDYLAKPFNTRELLARIRALIRRESGYDDNILTFGNVSLNCLNYVMSTEFGSVKLPNKEFQIMELLMKKSNMIISSDTLLEAVWNADDFISNENLWVFISYVRRKLSSISANIEIKSNRNVGYSLVVKND